MNKEKEKTALKNKIRWKKHFFHLKMAEKNIYQNLLSSFKQHYLLKDKVFQQYREKILTVALFLFTTSSFLYRKSTEKLLNFHWRAYTQLFSKGSLMDFLDCSLIYLYENECFLEQDREEIERYLPKNIPSFNEAYVLSIIKKNTITNELNLLGISFDKYRASISLALKIFEVIKYQLPQNYAKVLDLVELSEEWKEGMRELFGFKSEYIAFLFFVNLRRKDRECWKIPWFKFNGSS